MDVCVEFVIHGSNHSGKKRFLAACGLGMTQNEPGGGGVDFNTLRPRQNGRHFAEDTFKRIFLNENDRILIEILLEFVPKGPINNIPALVQIMAWCRPGDKPLFEPIMVTLLTHICVTWPQWVNPLLCGIYFWKYKNVFAYSSFLLTKMAQVVEIILHGRQEEPTYLIFSIPWLLMPWRHKEPGH